MIKPYHRPNIAVKDLLNPTDDIPKTMDAFLSEIIHDEWDPRFGHSRQKEFDGVLTKESLKVVERSSLPTDANRIGNIFFLCIKDADTTMERFKTRWILQGRIYKLRYLIPNSSPRLMRISFRTIVSFSVIYFVSNGVIRICCRDVEQAFIQSNPLQREVYTNGLPEAQLLHHNF